MNTPSETVTGDSLMPALQFRRGRLYRMLPLLALVFALFALLSPLIPGLSGDQSLRIPSLSGAIGLLAALVLMRARSMSSIIAHYFITLPMVLLALGSAGEFLTPEFILPVSIIAIFAAAYALLYEKGLMIEISERGFRRVSRYSRPKDVLIRWDEIETVTADMRRITTRFVGESLGSTDQKNRIVVQGNGKTVILGTPPFRWVRGSASDDSRWISAIYPQMAPAAIGWTIKQIQQRGLVILGPIEIAKGVVSIRRRLLRKQRIRFADLRKVELKAGSIHFSIDGKTTKTPLRGVPNGLYLPEILRAAGWRGE